MTASFAASVSRRTGKIKLNSRRRFPRWIKQGKVVTSAGISAGIDMCLHLAGRLVSPALAQATARQMDYAWHAAAADCML